MPRVKPPINGAKMPLKECLHAIGRWYGISGGELIAYAAEDTLLGGVEGNPYGTSYANDGHVLYALVRYMKPRRILELGTDHGGSAKHLAAACQRNGQGHVWTVDINEQAGDGLTTHDSQWITQIFADAAVWIADYGNEPFDFIFEDASHSEFMCHRVYESLPQLLTPTGFILSHDICTGVGEAIWNGIRKGGCGLEHVHIFAPEPSPLGFTIYQYQEATYVNG